MKDNIKSNTNGILRQSSGGYNLFIKDDGTDYIKIWKDFKAGKLDGLRTLTDISHRKAYHINIKGRDYLLKVDTKCPRPLDMKIWRFIHGPYHSKHMKAVNKAVNQGCKRTQDIYFVAEKKGRICTETFLIIEYLPGQSLCGKEIENTYKQDIAAALAELHSYKLSLSDIHPGNFLITKNGINVIDLSTKGIAWAGIGRDIIEAKQNLGINVPVQNFSERLSVWYVLGKRGFRDGLRTVRSFFF